MNLKNNKMKQMRFLVLLALTLFVSSTAYSQITGLDREQKVAIVSTIESYDAILIEVDLQEQLLTACKQMEVLLRQQLNLKDEIIYTLKDQIKGYKEEVGVQNKKIRSQKLKNGVLISGAAGLLILSIIMN
jgi:hypothetical protein